MEKQNDKKLLKELQNLELELLDKLMDVQNKIKSLKLKITKE